MNTAQATAWEKAGPVWLREEEGVNRQCEIHGLRCVEAANPSPGEFVLDIGSGTGTTTFQLSELVGPSGSVVGADISDTMVEAAKGHARAMGVSNISFMVADAQVHKFDEPFDLVYSRFGMMFFEDPTAAFANIQAALKPSGRIALVCWQAAEKNEWVGVSRQAVLPLLPRAPMPAPDAPGPFSLANPDRVKALMEGAGFNSVVMDGFETKVSVGTTLDEATDFLFAMRTASLDVSDPSLATKARATMRDALRPFVTANGVEMDSATWIVTARA